MSTKALARILFLISPLVLCSCLAVRPSSTSNDLELVRSWIDAQWPQSKQVYKTTSSEIYLANLNASISSLDRLITDKLAVRTGTQLADKLYHRYKILGRFTDAEAALSIIRQLTRQPEAGATSFLSLAGILAGFHLFNDALAALDHAVALGGDAGRIADLSREINTAIGIYQFPTDISRGYPDHITTAQQALLGGDFVLASTHFRQAELSYRGTDPYVLAWIQLQQGIAFLRYGDSRTANYFFKLAHERMPEFYLVTEHLAETEFLLGELTAAEQLYKQVSEQTGHPQFYYQLARVQALLGDLTASQRSSALASAGFDQLAARYPLAMGDHAVNFYLQQRQGDKALSLARKNLANRHNIESWILLANTALAVKADEEACQAYSSAIQLRVHPVEMDRLTERIAGLCKTQ